MKKVGMTIALGLVLATSGCSVFTASGDPNCVTVVVDFQKLNDGNKTSQCIYADKGAGAIDILNKAGFKLEGTGKYGNQVVCRVNGFPSATKPIGVKDHEDYIETCADMPADFAYWAVLVKTPGKDWSWAEVGVADLKLNPGESLALVFSENDKLALPN